MGDVHRLPNPSPIGGLVVLTPEDLRALLTDVVRQELAGREAVAADDPVSTKKMAELLGKHHSTLQKWTIIKSCPAFRSGKRPWAWPVDETRTWVREYFNG